MVGNYHFLSGDNMKEYLDLTYDNIGNKLDLYIPDNNNFKTVIFIHGGGFVEGDKAQDNIKEIGYEFIKNGYAFASVNYRMYPTAKYPDYIIDACNAIKYLNEKISLYKGLNQFILSGQSAGAYTTLMIMLSKEFKDYLGDAYNNLIGFISDSAQTTTHFRVLEKEYNLDPYIERIDDKAPIYYVDNSTIFSRLLLICYKDDIIKRKAQNEMFYETIKYFNKDASAELVILDGGHCNGSCNKNKNSEYDYVNVALDWLKRNL